MPFKAFLSLSLLVLSACDNNQLSARPQQSTGERAGQPLEEINPYEQIDQIPLPEGFRRIETDGFGLFLRQVKLKKDRTVFLYTGRPKINQDAQFAVIDISTGDQDLQQCADAVMRLKAEYLFRENRYEDIRFRDNSGKAYTFQAPYTRSHFSAYLHQVFGACGSASLSRELHPVDDMQDIKPGDVLIRGGFPGHAVIVMDVAINAEKEKIYLLAQGYMPAQDMHVLLNPNDALSSPWYRAGLGPYIFTPEYTFKTTELKRC